MAIRERRRIYDMNQIDVGDGTNKTAITSTGRQTMAGTARVRKTIFIPATDWYGVEPNQFANAFNATAAASGSTPAVRPFGMNFGPASGSTVAMPVLSASITGACIARAATWLWAPSDADTTGSVAVQVVYTTKVAMANAGSMNVFRLHYRYLGSSGSADLASPSGSILYGASMTTTGNGKMEVKSIGNIPSFAYSTSPFVALQLTLHDGSASHMAGSCEEQIFGVVLTYTACALGTASSE